MPKGQAKFVKIRTIPRQIQRAVREEQLSRNTKLKSKPSKGGALARIARLDLGVLEQVALALPAEAAELRDIVEAEAERLRTAPQRRVGNPALYRLAIGNDVGTVTRKDAAAAIGVKPASLSVMLSLQGGKVTRIRQIGGRPVMVSISRGKQRISEKPSAAE
jgi:hypothetical protein